MEKIGLRPLPQAEEIVEKTGLKVTYNYDDLIFVEHNAFIAQFNDNKPEQLFIHFNIDCEEEEAKNLLRNMEYKANELGMIVIRGKKYTLEQKDDAEEMELKFFD